jgi:pimeloyl-ACP methyl ester carboxylesterase
LALALIAFTKSGGYSAFRFKKLSQIGQPTLILWGDSDKILGTVDAQRFKRAIPNSKLIWIKDCGHVPHLEQPQITARTYFRVSGCLAISLTAIAHSILKCHHI